MRRAVPYLLACACALLLPAAARGATLTPITESNFTGPVHVASEPDNPDRLYVVEQVGRIQLVTENGTTEFVDLTPVVHPDDPALMGEQGLLSVAFPPDYATSRKLYVFYTDRNNDLHVAELTASGNTADPETLRDVLTITHRPANNHNGGLLQFGPDGYLYVGVGDGGGSNDPEENAQNLNVLLGKMLRIDPREGPGGEPYTVPLDNPFAGATPGRDEIWSYGLRNPWRYSFDSLTGDLAIGDVGQAAWEEIDFATAPNAGRGVNWGWDCFEGNNPVTSDPSTSCPSPVGPAHQYQRPSGTCASVVGGVVVRDPGLTELYGRYLFADTCGDWISSAVLTPTSATSIRDEGSIPAPVSFAEDACGRAYVVSLAGSVRRFEDGTPTDCSAVVPPPPPPEIGRCGEIVRGGDGDDDLRGGPGDQDVYGLKGADSLRGEAGDDCVDGGAGKDVVRGGDGSDELNGGRGKDSLSSRDGARDRVSCGPGKDRVKADEKDRLRGCERANTRG